jgi:uncharacterized protein (DUF2252 family)
MSRGTVSGNGHRGARENGFSYKVCRQMAVSVVRTYCWAMEQFAQMHAMDVRYYHVDTDAVLAIFEATSSKRAERRTQKLIRKARSKTHQQTLEKVTRVEACRRRIMSDPPRLVPLWRMGQSLGLSQADLRQMTEDAVESAWAQYLDSLPDERRYLLQHFQLVAAALRVGGVGSVGTRCLLALLEGGARDDALLLKEAGSSALEPYLNRRGTLGHAECVVTGQRLMQTASDIFLGWHKSELGEREFYWRQLKDMKGSAEVGT